VIELRVLDRTTGIAGAYCSKVLADAGADVVKVERPDGDSMRRTSPGLFEYLHASKRSVTTAGDDLTAGADVVLTNDPDEAARLHQEHAGLVAVSISPYGSHGPWADRPATEFVLQAACGSMGSRGTPERPPIPAGGRIGEWLTGTYAAVATLAATHDHRGRHVDVAMLDCMAVSLTTYPSVFSSFAGWPEILGTGRTVEVPSIEPTSNGFVVFTTNSAQQFQDFVVMIGRSDWLDDPGLARAQGRWSRRAEFLDAVHRWTQARSSASALEEAAAFRIPAGPVLNGCNVVDFEQFVLRGVFERAASGRFRRPRVPYRIEGEAARSVGAAPETGADDGAIEWPPRLRRRGGPADGTAVEAVEAVEAAEMVEAAAGDKVTRRPLAGYRVLDCTAWWAGPEATHVLASLGADVIKIESVTRPDLMRMATVKAPSEPQWWEWGGIFHPVNASKRGVTIDLSRPAGVQVFERLVRDADAVVENYTPRVMEQFGLGWDRLKEVNPGLVMLRMPAFGLDGPWRDRTGFAQTMESMSGMAWVTGFPDGPPVLPRGPCDPLAGLHAVVALLVALAARRRDGRGRLVEATMMEAALNVTAEQLIQWDVSGRLMERLGTRGTGEPGWPQGVYACAGEDEWVAIAIESDEQWETLCAVTGLSAEPGWSTEAGRLADADAVDALLSGWCGDRSKEDAAMQLADAGVPAAAVVAGRDVLHNPQLRYRGLFEVEDHPVSGRHELPGMPFRYSDVDAWMTRPSPTLGQHNDEVLSEVAPVEELAELRREGVIGETLVFS
jgi:crotonobetainyl-CoA:carnitine CoA-transferase CaiB-like acyl-CoA transferase